MRKMTNFASKKQFFSESESGEHFHASAVRAIDFLHDFTPKNDNKIDNVTRGRKNGWQHPKFTHWVIVGDGWCHLLGDGWVNFLRKPEKLYFLGFPELFSAIEWFWVQSLITNWVNHPLSPIITQWVMPPWVMAPFRPLSVTKFWLYFSLLTCCEWSFFLLNCWKFYFLVAQLALVLWLVAKKTVFIARFIFFWSSTFRWRIKSLRRSLKNL